jgi:hypothetical protein
MKVSEAVEAYALASGGTWAPKAGYKGIVMNDVTLLAIDASSTQNANVQDYAVLELGAIGFASSMNAATVDRNYIRQGPVTIKTTQQRTFKVTGDRYMGDEAQDFLLSNAIKYGIGMEVVVKYVLFNLINGQGEKGLASIIVNSDGSGNAGETASIDIDLKKFGPMPEDYTYSPPE